MGEPPENLEEKLRETRKQIAAAINEKSALERIATPSADIEARVKAHVAELAQRARPYVRGVSGGKLSVRWPPRPDSSVAGSIDWTQDTANPLMLTALLLPDQLAEVILVEIEREANKDLTVAQREARIEELNIVIEELQRRASDLVFHLVRAGHEETFTKRLQKRCSAWSPRTEGGCSVVFYTGARFVENFPRADDLSA